MSDQQQPSSGSNPPQGGASYGQSQSQPPSYGGGQGQPPSYGGGGGQGQPPSYGGGQGQPPSYGGGGGQPPYGGGGYGQNPYGSQGQPGSVPSEKSFFGKLFDFSFSSYVTPSIVKIVYGIVLVVIVLAWLVYTIYGFSEGVGLGLVFFIGGAIISLLYVIFARITLEFYIAVIRVAQDVSDIKARR